MGQEGDRELCSRGAQIAQEAGEAAVDPGGRNGRRTVTQKQTVANMLRRRQLIQLAAWSQCQGAPEDQRMAHIGQWYLRPWSGAKRNMRDACKKGRDIELPTGKVLHDDQYGGARAEGPRDCDTVPNCQGVRSWRGTELGDDSTGSIMHPGGVTN